MNRKLKLAVGCALGIIGLVLVGLFVSTHDIAVLNPEGAVGQKQRDLLIIATLLGLLVIVPVFVMTFGIAWKYRASNKNAAYQPEWAHSKLFETIWWGVPIAIIIVLGVITWFTSHSLDPYRPLDSDVKPVRVQVVALQWKWLFIYPEEGIATVNYLQIPEKTPINFEITADAPMNAFWIPKLGSQVYAMAGMTTKLHLIANNPGEYQGSSANISGEGFADMNFIVKATSQADYSSWVHSIHGKNEMLTQQTYDSLAKPSVLDDAKPRTYVLHDERLYDRVVMKYMMPETSDSEQQHEAAHSH
jgi:cytochrome o ubiquinol oxidase subunit 2